MKKSLMAGILITLLLLTSCTQPPAQSPAPAPTEIPETQPTEPTSEPKLLKVVGQIGGPTQAVAVQGDYAYVGVGLQLIALDITSSASPMEIGATEPFEWYVENIAVVGNTAFIVAGSAGLYIVDISDPTHPTVIGSYDTQGYAEGVAIAGKYAYVADGPAGLRVIDITTLAQPTEVATVYNLSYIFDVAVEGHYAYMAAAGAGLLIADVSDPIKPRKIGSLDTPGYAYGLTVSGSIVYVADGWGGLRIVDVSTPAQPKEVGAHDTAGWVFDVVLAKDKAYLATGWGGLQVVDISDRTAPEELILWGGKWLPGGEASGLALRENLVYVVGREEGLRVVDISNPSKPVQIGSYTPLGFAGSVAVSENYAYTAGAFAYPSDLRISDLSDAVRPREIAASGAIKSAQSVKVANDFAYMFAESGLRVIDISNPMQPKAVSFQSLDGPPVSMFLSERTAYITTEFGFELVDISNPASLSKLGTLDFTGGLGRAAGAATAMGVTVSGNLAYVTHSKNGLMVIDISSPGNPRLVTSYKPPDVSKPMSVVVAGDIAYLGDHGRLLVIDISNPKQPQILSVHNIPTAVAEQMILADKTLYVAGAVAGLLAIDVTDPQKPITVGYCQVPGRAFDLALDAKYIYVASGEGGLYIIERPTTKNTAGNTSPTPFKTETGIPSNVASLITASLRNQMPGLVQLSPSLGNGSLEYWPTRQNNLLQAVKPYPTPAILPGSGQTLTVTSPADSGTGTLRWALQNAQSGDVITFDSGVFPPKSPVSIEPKSPLPYLSQGSLTIDASNAGVILDGSATPKGTHGLLITSDHNVVKGLQVIGFPGAGIGIAGASYNIIGGDRARGTGPSGEGNVISGNKSVGVGIADDVSGVATDIGAKSSKGAVGNRIIGNYIGTDASGTKPLGSQGTGVWVYGKTVLQNVIGGFSPVERNIISGNVRAGVSLIGRLHDNIVVGNYIGTDVTGTSRLGNNWGVSIEGGFDNLVTGNVISGNGGDGVIISDPGASDNTITGNLIGTDATGSVSLGNGGAGVSINESFNRVGGTASGERNVVSGNGGPGIKVGWRGTTDIIVIGNYIGTDITGTKALGNGSDGIRLTEGTYHNFIGGTTNAERNVLSANAGSGVRFAADGGKFNFITGNYIGTDVSGSGSLPNQSGIEIGKSSADIGGSKFNFISDNLIAYNKKGAVVINSGEGNTIWRNRFVDNMSSASDSGRDNQWSLDEQGNYWSDYEGKDENGDGIGDTPQPVSPNGIDNYPLMRPLDERLTK